MCFKSNKSLLLAGKKLKSTYEILVRAHHSQTFVHSHPPYS